MADVVGAQPDSGKSFFAVYATAFWRPKRAMAALLGDPRRLRWGACGVAVTAVT
jgi:hypothetical protein